MPIWNPWPSFVPPAEYAGDSAQELLDGIILLAQAVPPSDPDHPAAQAALQKAQELSGHQEAALAPLLRKWGRVAGAHRFAEEGDWSACRGELDLVT